MRLITSSVELHWTYKENMPDVSATVLVLQSGPAQQHHAERFSSTALLQSGPVQTDHAGHSATVLVLQNGPVQYAGQFRNSASTALRTGRKKSCPMIQQHCFYCTVDI